MNMLKTGLYSILTIIVGAVAIMGMAAICLVWICRVSYMLLTEPQERTPPVGWDYDRFPKGPKA